MLIPDDDPLFIDRLARSYVTSALSCDRASTKAITERVDEFKEDPRFTAQLLTTLTAVSLYIMSGQLGNHDEDELYEGLTSESPTPATERFLAKWSEMSYEIEIGGDDDE